MWAHTLKVKCNQLLSLTAFSPRKWSTPPHVMTLAQLQICSVPLFPIQLFV